MPGVRAASERDDKKKSLFRLQKVPTERRKKNAQSSMIHDGERNLFEKIFDVEANKKKRKVSAKYKS